MDVEIPLAQYRSVAKYTPRVGDFVVWHGWITHYFGVISGASDSIVEIVYAGMPNLLFTMRPQEMSQKRKTVDLYDIRNSKGAYAIQQKDIWYI